MAMIVSTVIVLAVVGLLMGLMLVSASEKFKVEVDPRETAVRECLPGNNCGACGYAGCDALAAAIARGEAPVNGCPVGGAAVGDRIAEVMGVAVGAELEKKVAFIRCAGTCDTHPPKCTYIGIETCEAAMTLPGKGIKACTYGCLGYGSCADACPFGAIQVADGLAKVDRSKCVACGKCVAACPQKLIEIVPDEAVYAVQCSNREKGVFVKQLCAAGCIGCGLCVRQCEHDAVSVTGNVAHIDYAKCVGCGKCAEKCPVKIIRTR